MNFIILFRRNYLRLTLNFIKINISSNIISLWGRQTYGLMLREKNCLVMKSCPSLCDPLDCSPPGSSVNGISQEEYGSGLPFPSPGHLSEGMEPTSPALAGRCLTPRPLGKPVREECRQVEGIVPGTSSGYSSAGSPRTKRPSFRAPIRSGGVSSNCSCNCSPNLLGPDPNSEPWGEPW